VPRATGSPKELVGASEGEATAVVPLRDGAVPGCKVCARSQFWPKIAFIYIGLPHMSGYDVARRLREDTKYDSLVLVAVTGFGAEYRVPGSISLDERCGVFEYFLRSGFTLMSHSRLQVEPAAEHCTVSRRRTDIRVCKVIQRLFDSGLHRPLNVIALLGSSHSGDLHFGHVIRDELFVVLPQRIGIQRQTVPRFVLSRSFIDTLYVTYTEMMPSECRVTGSLNTKPCAVASA
jgi:CheY-like chemotaxis protein